MQIVKSSSTIQSLQVGMSIIEAIALEGNPLRFTDIQRLTNLTKSNLYKYLNTLTQLELLHREKTTGLYHLGNKWIQFGMAAIGQVDVVSGVTPYMQEISSRTNCTVILTVWSYNGPIIASIQSSNHALNIGAQMGSILPPTSSTGKIFTCFQHSSETSEWLSRTDHGPGNKQLSEHELQQIKTDKIAFAKEPLVPSISSMSIPIFNYSGEILASITVVGFADTIPSKPNEELSQYLINISTEISRTFGYTPE